MNPKYPGKQYMRAFVWRTIPEVYDSVANCRWILKGTDKDITVYDIQEETITQADGEKLHSVRYTVEWFTYTGWRAYMLLTGVLTPRTEPKTEPQIAQNVAGRSEKARTGKRSV